MIDKYPDHTFKPLLEEYLAGLDDSKVHTLEDLVKFNEAHAEEELSVGKFSAYFGN